MAQILLQRIDVHRPYSLAQKALTPACAHDVVRRSRQSFNRTLRSYLGYRTDLSEHLKASVEADPSFGLAHCAKG